MDANRPTDRPPPADSHEVERCAAAWLARRDRGDWGEADVRALDAWLEAAAGHRVAFLRLQSAWEQSGRMQALGAGLGKGVPERGRWAHLGAGAVFAGAGPQHGQEHGRHADAQDELHPHGRLAFATRAPTPAPRRNRRAYAALSASVILAATLAWGWQLRDGVDSTSHSTAMGDIHSLPLADGSRTVLGSASRIDVRLSRSERRIDLQQGEAFFEAARDPRRPFVVHAGGRRVTAVGTRFSVRRDGPDLRVVVTEGTVRLESDPHDGQQRPAALLPAGSVAFATATGVTVRSGAIDDAERMLDWQHGLLVFDDATLAEAAAEFNRYNARRIVIADDDAGALRIGGSFRWSNAEGFVRLIEQGFPVRAEYFDDAIVLHRQ